MRLLRHDYVYSIFLFIVSCILVFDLFSQVGRPATFDASLHIINIAQFYTALQDGDFPVVWTDGFANYGLPSPIISHQLTNYLGASLTFFTHNPTESFLIITLIGIFLANIFYYLFLRFYFQPHIAFAGAVLFNFSSYRIINLYIRGAIPELFSQLFLPLIFIGTYLLVKKKSIIAFFLLCLAFFLLAITHPMMLVIYSFLFFPYLCFLLFVEKEVNKLKTTGLFLVSIITGVAMASYYLLPLTLEIKYFYYGLMENHIAKDSYLSLANYFIQNWSYFTDKDVFTRGHVLIAGLIESSGVILGICYIFWRFIVKKSNSTISIFEFAVGACILIIFFTTRLSDIFYQRISILSNIQFPWRMLSAFVFLPPVIYAFFLSKLPRFATVIFIVIVAIITFPQLYGKNYVDYPQKIYFFNPLNAHSVMMNTIWSGKSEDYPIKPEKIEIIEGTGTVISKTIKNSSRAYSILADTKLTVVDYTFYFPGWHVFVDNRQAPIEFQNPEYRGVITYSVPPGKHEIRLQFQDTKVRWFSKILSLAGFAFFVLLFLLRKRLSLLLVNTI